MPYSLTKNVDVFKKEKHSINLAVYDDIGDCGLVVVDTTEGHNQEFYHRVSTFHYIVLEGQGSFFLDDEEVLVTKGDCLSVAPNTRIYYKGAMKLILITNPPWTEEGEVETRPTIW